MLWLLTKLNNDVGGSWTIIILGQLPDQGRSSVSPLQQRINPQSDTNDHGDHTDRKGCISWSTKLTEYFDLSVYINRLMFTPVSIIIRGVAGAAGETKPISTAPSRGR